MSHIQMVRPAGAGHETLYVLLLCGLILLAAAGVVALRQDTPETQPLASHQLDARRDLNAAEQGIYADLQVAAEEIQALREDGEAVPEPEELAAQGFPPFTADAAASNRGNHHWSRPATNGEIRYLGLSQQPEIAGSFLLRIPQHQDSAGVEVWLKRGPLPAQSPLPDSTALAANGWRQVHSQFDGGVTRQHRH